jgi:hypothetical protein
MTDMRSKLCPVIVLGEGTICNNGFPYVVDVEADKPLEDPKAILCKPGIGCGAWREEVRIGEHIVPQGCKRLEGGE